MTKMRRPFYSEQTKRRAVAASRRDGMAAAAAEFGCCEVSISKWAREFGEAPIRPAFDRALKLRAVAHALVHGHAAAGEEFGCSSRAVSEWVRLYGREVEVTPPPVDLGELAERLAGIAAYVHGGRTLRTWVLTDAEAAAIVAQLRAGDDVAA